MGSTAYELKHPKTKRKKTQNTGSWGGYIDCPLGKAERKAFTTYVEKSVISVSENMQAMLDENINLSMSWSEKNEAYLAKATQESSGDRKMYMLSGFHADVETAWLVLFYKHFILMQGSWFDVAGDDGNEEKWG